MSAASVVPSPIGVTGMDITTSETRCRRNRTASRAACPSRAPRDKTWRRDDLEDAGNAKAASTKPGCRASAVRPVDAQELVDPGQPAERSSGRSRLRRPGR
jgi:hypothetical protein